MRILLVNKFHYLKGGSETYYFNLKSMLEENGHDVIEFSMKDSRNIYSKYTDYFIDNIDYNAGNSILNKVKLAVKLSYSFEARNKIEKLVSEYKPDIAHLHIFQHQISPSILWALKKHNIPVVYTAHDFKMICPNYKMFLDSGKICEQCKGGRYYNCVKNKCVKGSLTGSMAAVVEAYLHKILKSYDIIDKIVTPSNFYRKKFVEFGVDINKLAYIPNFLDKSKYNFHPNYDDYYIYFGRLSQEKGIETLIEASLNVNSKLKILGTGPLKKKLIEYAEIKSMGGKIEFLGYKSGDELRKIIEKSMFVVVPSCWYENAPYSILEAMAIGKPIIGSDIGGITEVVKDKETGLLFQAGNYKDLTDKINFLLNHKELIEQFGENARALIDKVYDKENHYEKIISIYKNLINRR